MDSEKKAYLRGGLVVAVWLLAAFTHDANAAPAGDCSNEPWTASDPDVIGCEPWDSESWFDDTSAWCASGDPNTACQQTQAQATPGDAAIETDPAKCINAPCLRLPIDGTDTIPNPDNAAFSAHWHFGFDGDATTDAMTELSWRFYHKLGTAEKPWAPWSCYDTEPTAPSHRVASLGGHVVAGGKMGIGPAMVRNDSEGGLGNCGNGGAPTPSTPGALPCWTARMGWAAPTQERVSGLPYQAVNPAAWQPNTFYAAGQEFLVTNPGSGTTTNHISATAGGSPTYVARYDTGQTSGSAMNSAEVAKLFFVRPGLHGKILIADGLTCPTFVDINGEMKEACAYGTLYTYMSNNDQRDASWSGVPVNSALGSDFGKLVTLEGVESPAGIPCHKHPRITDPNHACHENSAFSAVGNRFAPTATGPAMIRSGEWMLIEAYIKISDPDVRNGVMKVWVDGELVHHSTRIKTCVTPGCIVQSLWAAVYHGGPDASCLTTESFFDELVIMKGDNRIGAFNDGSPGGGGPGVVAPLPYPTFTLSDPAGGTDPQVHLPGSSPVFWITRPPIKENDITVTVANDSGTVITNWCFGPDPAMVRRGYYIWPGYTFQNPDWVSNTVLPSGLSMTNDGCVNGQITEPPASTVETTIGVQNDNGSEEINFTWNIN